MALDVTQNQQYISLKQNYDTQIATDQKVQDLWNDFKKTESDIRYTSYGSPEYETLSAQYQQQMNLIASPGYDPDGSIRQQIVDGKDPVAQLKQQESDALDALSKVLIGPVQTNGANTTALNTDPATTSAKSGPVHGSEDIMTRAMGVFAMLSDATDGVSNNYMDLITGNVDQITDLNASSQTVRGARPTGKATDTCTISGADMDKLTNNGVTIPSDLKADTNGNYTVSQADCDTLLNNIQSQSSSLTTLNQNTTISLNKSIDVGQQCSQFQTSELEKWSQLMSKILS